MKKPQALLLCLIALLSSSFASAGTYGVERVTIEDVTVIQLGLGTSHLPGNLEIKIRGGFTLPAGASCAERVVITTLKTVDADRRLFALLLSAQASKQPVTLWVTDDPAYTAYPGRCSLVGASVTQ